MTKSRLAVRATPADRPGDQQQDEEQAKREDPESPRRNREFACLEQGKAQGHTRSVAAQSRVWPDPVITYLVEVISGRPIGPRACSF